MENIYELLRKHFLQEATGEEEKLVSEFKKNNLQEYQILKQLWWCSINIKIKKFNSNKAWAKIVLQANKKKTINISLYSKLRRIAAVALILIASALTIYVIRNKISSKELTIITSVVTTRNEIMLNDGQKIWLNKKINNLN